MNTNDIMVLGLNHQAPWRLVNQHLELSKNPHELQLEVTADRGSQYPEGVQNFVSVYEKLIYSAIFGD